MAKDRAYLRQQIKSQRQKIAITLKMKFGKVIDINEIEEAILKKSFQKTQVNEVEEVILKRLVYDLRMKTTDIKQIYAKVISSWSRKISAAQDELSEAITENTIKLELHKVLNRDRQELEEIIKIQPKKEEFINKNQETFQKTVTDLEKLENIVQGQLKELQDLKREIKMLKTKGMGPQVEEIKEDWKEYGEYYMPPEEEEDVEEIPDFYPMESEDIVRELLKSLMSNALEKLHKVPFIEETVKDIVNIILKRTSAADIINDILERVPFVPSDEQMQAITNSAHKLLEIQEVSEESLKKCSNVYLEEIIDEAALVHHESHEMIPGIVEHLVQALPIDFLMEEESLKIICNKIRDLVPKDQLSEAEIKKYLKSIQSANKTEMKEIINTILERVFDTGLD